MRGARTLGFPAGLHLHQHQVAWGVSWAVSSQGMGLLWTEGQ